MASTPSQDFVQAKRLIKRRFFQVPQDQKELLDSDDAWSENLSRGSRRMVNVPPEVVDEVKGAHGRENEDSAQQPSLEKPESSNAASAPLSLSRCEKPIPSPVPAADNEEEAQGTPIPWTPSPPRLTLPSQSAEQTQPLIGFPIVDQQETQPRRKASPEIVDVPPSSAAQSDELEIQVLEALSQESQAPVNRPASQAVTRDSAQPRATPPSAQAQIIPSTFNGTEESDERQPPAKRQRRTGNTTSPGKTSRPREQSRISEVEPRPLSTPTGRRHKSPATTTSTPSLIIKATSEQPSQSSLPRVASASGADRRSSSNPTPTWEGRRPAKATQQETILQAPESSHLSSRPRAPQAAQRSITAKSTRQSLASAQGSPVARTPYENFRVAYPDYQESVGIFVSALLYVEILKRDWALPEFLYDDFVRAFSTGYLQYVSMSAIRKANQVLTAVQWYNDRVRDMQYRRRVITKENIHSMVKAYPTEARKIRESVGGSGVSDEAADEVADEELDHDLANELEQDEEEAHEPGRAERKDRAYVNTDSPELHISSPGIEESMTITAPVRSGTPPMSQVDHANKSVTSGQSPPEDINLGDPSDRRFTLAREINGPADEHIFDEEEKAASNLVQSDADLGEAAEENELQIVGSEAGEGLKGLPDPEEHAVDDNMPGSQSYPELRTRSPLLESTGVPASIEEERPEEANGMDQGRISPSRLFATQEDVQLEDYWADETSEDEPGVHCDIDRSRNPPETHRQTSEGVIAEEMHRNGATLKVKATPSSGKSLAVGQASRGSSNRSSTPITSETGSIGRRLLAPLPATSTPLSGAGITNTNADGPLHERPTSPLVSKAQDMLEFRSQVDSSDEEPDPFDPPVGRNVAVPPRRSSTYTPSASRKQAQPSDEGLAAFETPVKPLMPPPRGAAGSSPAFKPGTTSRTRGARPTPTPTVAATSQTELIQKVVRVDRKVVPRVSDSPVSKAGRSGTPASSDISYANVSVSKKRLNETKEERSRKLKEHFRKRLTGKTPSSSAVSRR